MKLPDIRIETERLVLRLPQRDDFDGYADMLADVETARYIGGTLSRGAAWRKFLQMPGAWAMQGFAMFSVVERDTGRWLGQLGPWQPDGWPGTEIGWVFHREAWGKGYAMEAGEAAIAWAFDHLGWTEVIHSIDPGNVASQKLAARLGSTTLRSGYLLPAPSDTQWIDLWGQSRTQWLARRSADASV